MPCRIQTFRKSITQMLIWLGILNGMNVGYRPHHWASLVTHQNCRFPLCFIPGLAWIQEELFKFSPQILNGFVLPLETQFSCQPIFGVCDLKLTYELTSSQCYSPKLRSTNPLSSKVNLLTLGCGEGKQSFYCKVLSVGPSKEKRQLMLKRH